MGDGGIEEVGYGGGAEDGAGLGGAEGVALETYLCCQLVFSYHYFLPFFTI